MSIANITPEELRAKNLVRVARLAIVLTVFASALYIYLGITTQNWFYYLAAASFITILLTSAIILHFKGAGNSPIGAWHLLSVIILTSLLISALQTNAGAEIGSAVLVIVLVIVIQTLPPEQTLKGAILGTVASLISGILAFYSPIPQSSGAAAATAIQWVAGVSTLAFLASVMMRFRTLTLSNKLLITFLGVVVAISLTFNIVLTATTTGALNNQVGQQLHSAADLHSTLLGDHINSQVDALRTLALDETIRQSVRAANALKPSLDEIIALDEQWQQAVAAHTIDPLINGRLNNSLSKDLLAFQQLYPENSEVFVTDQQGALVSATDVTSDYYQADETWWQAAYNDSVGNVYISMPELDQSTGKLSILLAVPIYDTRGGDLIGILRSTLAIDNVLSILQSPIGQTGEADVLFPNGKMLDAKKRDYEDVSPASLAAIHSSANNTYVAAAFEGYDSILSQVPIRAKTASSKVNDLGWVVIISQHADEALAPVQQQIRIINIFGTLMAGIAALLSLVVAQRLAQPIANLTETTREIAGGNLNARAQVESQDEIGQLAETFNDMTAQLQDSLESLEQRVEERTIQLEKSSHQLQRRASQFEAISLLARTISTIQNLDELLPKITQLVSKRFGFYHVGLFLLDESGRYAVLSAANSEGGQRMLARKHRLGVGQTGIVGYVTSTGNPRIVLDTGTDAVYFDNPDLPDTRSEMALPLRLGQRIIGALDVQSTEANAFSEDDIEVLSILADSISIAIENARLFEESQRVLVDAQSAFGEYTKEAWKRITSRRKTVGYEFSGVALRPLEKPAHSTEIKKALKTGKTSLGKKATTIAVPIKLRDQVIGAMNIQLPKDKTLDDDEVDITQALAERVGVAIENATLLEESRRLAARESIIGDISAKISATAQIERIMQVAAGEIRQALGAEEVIVKIEASES